MSRPDSNKPPASKRIDVSTQAPVLKHSPFAALTVETPLPPAAPSQPEAPRPAAARAPANKSRGRLVLRRETKHRGGKAVVLISGFATLREPRDRSPQALAELAQQLKQKLGCGGSVDTDRHEVLIQGDRPAEVAALLRGLGFEVAGVVS